MLQNKIVIIQGEVTEWTKKSIETFKKITDAKIIFSTWKGQKINTDIEVLHLDDPGPGPIQNFNRQLHGFNKALQYCESDSIIFKTRSDAIHNRDPFEIFFLEPVLNNGLNVLVNKIFISSVMSINPFFPMHDQHTMYRLFSPSDWFFLGTKKDVTEWFDIYANSKIVAEYVHCCEQIFCVSNFLKSAQGKLYNKDIHNIKNQQLSLDFVNTNLKIINTNRTFQASVGRYLNNFDTNPMYLKEK